ncbi:MAG: Phosphoribosylamine--glycine ligase, partial [Microgenomates bacterium OLB22]
FIRRTPLSRILVLGKGAREHALLWKLAQSPHITELFCIPGNAGTATIASNHDIPLDDKPALIAFAKAKKIFLTIVGPDELLAAGIVDAFEQESLNIIGPSRRAARIESSKAYSKRVMKTKGIPTASYRVFKSYERAIQFISSGELPLVIKVSGLAMGKGVFIVSSFEEAEKALQRILVKDEFGIDQKVVIEEYLVGEEVSFHALCNGYSAHMFPACQDHKTLYDGDSGPNTGGMGSICPVPWISDSLLKKVSQTMVYPVLEALRNEGHIFKGCLFPGAMMTPHGLMVLEYNARFGDPETQSYMRLLQTDLLDLLQHSVLLNPNHPKDLTWKLGFAVCVVLSSEGYPGPHEAGKVITGLEEADKSEGVIVFHAGTAIVGGQIVTAGGRVLSVTATGETPEEAVSRAYAAVEKIHFDGMHFRRDIGTRVLSRSS